MPATASSKTTPASAAEGGLSLRHLLDGDDEDAGAFAKRLTTLASELRDAATPEALLLSYLSRQPQVKEKRIAPLLATFQTAVELGHNLWPPQIRELVEGRDVLDYGCGNTFYGVVFRALGARSYLGIDPGLDPSTRRYRSRRNKGFQKTRLSVADAIANMTGVGYERAHTVTAVAQFDVALMHTVTEHLSDLDATLASLSRALRPSGQLWFLHDNFYSWAGHHGEPSSLSKLQPDDAEHRRLADWAHLEEDERDEAYWAERGLNRIRLDDLHSAVSRHFQIVSWREVPVGAKYRQRLSPEIRSTRGRGCSERELLTQHVICLAAKQS